MLFLPESPAWLISKQRIKTAEKNLRLLRNCDVTSPEYRQEINLFITKATMAKEQVSSETVFDLFKLPEFYKPIGIMFMLVSFQQLTGTFVLTTYAVKFSMDIGVKIDPFLCAVYIGFVRLLGALIVGVILDKYGRRLPTMFSSFTMGIGMCGTAVCMWLKLSPSWSLALILMYIFTAGLGLRTVPFVLLSELFSQRFRGFASGIIICILYTVSFAVTKLYPTMVNYLTTENVLMFYGVFSFLSIAYVYVYVPETNGKTLEEIEEIFTRKSRKDVEK